MAKKQTVQKTEGKVDEEEQIEKSIQEIIVQNDKANSNQTGQAEDRKLDNNNKTVQIPEFESSLLKLYNTYQTLYIDSKGGVFVQPHDDATEYANPYFIQ